ncbi:hypothetical protein A3F08_00100 [Candidatus Berkelbacteria bacterium RIFCSPHIGHO2_12_FULL_36_9]|uniref:HicB-like antitoxin of toxin-antitoxin system domain-containing protein n=1 Tax=Candidatus Berkelbacteria bacterium RIFCSPHIGHO2_12_FULL_36_9 TaxID=1797469 RepID=A0A1F5EEL4_9BACT|nr:MAG: hypothetical protein A3F08_00100 [Candidatus Berkelbacteria bacterium RIFCSPHIGHO2_12_FULL_36_9]
MKKNIKLQNVVWKEGKYFVAQCLNVEVSSFGKTRKEALCNLEEALELYFEDTKNTNITEIKQPEISKCSLTYA